MATGEHDPFSTGYKIDRLPKCIHDTTVKATMTFQYSMTPVISAVDWNAHAWREVTAQSYRTVTVKHFLEKLLRRIFLRISEGHAWRLAYTLKGTDGQACASILAQP